MSPNGDGGTAPRVGLEVLVLFAAKGGVLTCGDRQTAIEPSDWVFRQGARRSLVVEHLHVRGLSLEARAQSETARLPKEMQYPTRIISKAPLPEPFPWMLVGIVSGVVLVLGPLEGES